MSEVCVKWDFKSVKKYIIDNEYKLHSSSKDYINTKSKLVMECPQHHTVEIAFVNFKSGGRCKHCWKQRQKTTGFHKANLVLAKSTPERKVGKQY